MDGAQLIVAIQLIFSNGRRSPVFATKGTVIGEMTRVTIPEDQTIKRIKGDNKFRSIKKLIFEDGSGKEIARIFASDNNPGQEMELEEGEEIVGIYGNKNADQAMKNMGFIVWKPTNA